MTPEQVLETLRDGRYHSGSDIAKQIGGTRARVWQCIQQLQSWGVDIWRVRGRGYRLSPDVELIERTQVLAKLSKATKAQLSVADFALDLPSTNAHLLEAPLHGGFNLMVSEHQSAGKGRHGKTWLSPPAQNLSFSLAIQVDNLACLQALSLTVGLSVAHVLNDLGVAAQVKWPNDIYIGGQKAAGILVELKTLEDRSAKVVIGIGLNVNSSFSQADIAQQSTHVNHWLAQPVRRTDLLVALLERLIGDVSQHVSQGRQALLASWPQYDWLAGQTVNVLKGSVVSQHGEAVGIDDQGNLLVRGEDDQLAIIAHGEVSVRPAN